MENIVIKGYNDLSLNCYLFEAKNPKAVVQIVHGMQEHALRYVDFCEFLVYNNYTVLVSDLRGHGKTAQSKTGLRGNRKAYGRSRAGKNRRGNPQKRGKGKTPPRKGTEEGTGRKRRRSFCAFPGGNCCFPRFPAEENCPSGSGNKKNPCGKGAA